MKIGILGGTFDPPHNGHLNLANTAIDQLGLDEVILIPSYNTPFKDYHRPASVNQRLKMVELSIQNEPKISSSNIEITRGGFSYTVDTLTELQFARPAEYWFLMGSDNLINVASWKQPERLIKLCRLGVALRDPEDKLKATLHVPEEILEKVDWIEKPAMPISSTEIRRMIDYNRDISPWIKPDVLAYVQEKKLYKD